MLEPSRFRLIALILGLTLSLTASAGIYDDILVAAEKDDTAQVVDLLKRGMDVNTVDPSGSTLLVIASRNGNVDLLEFLLRNRANILKRNKYGDSAIMLAALRGHVAIVQKLLDAGADVGHAGWNALHYAAFNGRTDILRLMTKGKAALDAKAPNGQTALMLAAGAGHLEAVRVLVDADADMDLDDGTGRTALKLAKNGRHADVAEYLKASGAVE